MRRPRIGKSLTGISTPFGGASWETVPDLERQIVIELVTFLEDRRVLYNPSEVEAPSHCVDSVLRIREFVVEGAGRLSRDSHTAIALRNMAGACRRFLDRQTNEFGHAPLGPRMDWGYESWAFNQSVGELRGQIGVYLQTLIDTYDVGIEGQLATILPPPAEPDEAG